MAAAQKGKSGRSKRAFSLPEAGRPDPVRRSGFLSGQLLYHRPAAGSAHLHDQLCTHSKFRRAGAVRRNRAFRHGKRPDFTLRRFRTLEQNRKLNVPAADFFQYPASVSGPEPFPEGFRAYSRAAPLPETPDTSDTGTKPPSSPPGSRLFAVPLRAFPQPIAHDAKIYGQKEPQDPHRIHLPSFFELPGGEAENGSGHPAARTGQTGDDDRRAECSEQPHHKPVIKRQKPRRISSIPGYRPKAASGSSASSLSRRQSRRCPRRLRPLFHPQPSLSHPWFPSSCPVLAAQFDSSPPVLSRALPFSSCPAPASLRFCPRPR